MKAPAAAILLFLNGLLLGGLAGWRAAEALRPPRPAPAYPPLRYQFLENTDGQLSIFDQATGRHTTFVRTDGLWFVMTHDPGDGSVVYRRTRLIEDPAFLEAARELRNDFPGRLGGELILGPRREAP